MPHGLFFHGFPSSLFWDFLPMAFYAHTGQNPDRTDWQTLEAHLQGVVDLALAKCQDSFPGNCLVRDLLIVSAWLHDLGKYRQGFQDYLAGMTVPRESTLHKQAGALLAAQRKNLIASFVVAGHHGGLPNIQDLRELLAGPAAVEGLRESLERIEPKIREVLNTMPDGPNIQERLVGELLTRLVFSLLVDADGEDTGEHEAKTRGWSPRDLPPKLEPERDLKFLLEFVNKRSQSVDAGPTKDARDIVLNSCLEAAELPPGIYSLQVPTGGGKTLSSMAFALKHAQKYGLRRVISVAPYLTILEQTASVLRSALGREGDWDYLLEHHSLADADSENSVEQSFRKGPRGERWDSPIVITTNVQFWESLFGNKPGRCRKVHNIARSVILLDECQSIPPGYFQPACSMLKALVEQFQCTIVLCTATQPPWRSRPGFEEGLDRIREIVPLEQGLFRMLNRVNIEWPEREESLSWENLVQMVNPNPQALVMANTRNAAKKIFELLQKSDAESTFHLSTGLCPQHRRVILETVQARLAKGFPCKLVSTQVLEAGVDIDFPVVFRELAPLEAVLQAAGRCNREGRLNQNGKPGGQVRIFRSAERKIPNDGWYRSGISVVETLFLGSGRKPQAYDPELVEEYFKNLHSQGNLDQKQIQAMRQNLNFKETAEAFRLIEDGGYAVVVATWDPALEKVQQLLQKAKSPRPGNARKQLAAYQVNIRHYDMEKHGAWITEEAPGLFVYRGPYDNYLGMLADDAADQLLLI